MRASGSYVWDNQGKQYLDVIGGIVSISVGHNHPRIEKMKAMIAEDAIQHTTFLYLSQYMAELGKKIADVAPDELNKCYFTNSGSEANEMAVMSARVATGEKNGYFSTPRLPRWNKRSPLSFVGMAWKYPAQPQASVVHAMAHIIYRCPFNNKNGCHLECAEDVKNVIETTTHGQIAALLLSLFWVLVVLSTHLLSIIREFTIL